jgi:2-phospho-L-lactate guanylyltransferase
VSWTAIVPLKPPATRKTRLAGMLSPDERLALTDAMAAHVASVLMAHPLIGEVLLLTAAPPAGWPGGWRRDGGGGLNAELEAAVAALGPVDVAIVHADLPLLAAGDLDALLDAESAVALAPDRRDRGTNALAVRAHARFAAAFGEDSLARFATRWPDAAIVRRPGLALDIDTPDDLAAAEAAGFRWR